MSMNLIGIISMDLQWNVENVGRVNMKANEFIKDKGIDNAKRHLELYGWRNTPFIIKLKRLVESHELVSDYYGLTRAKEHAESNYTAPELKAALKQAIADVESCL